MRRSSLHGVPRMDAIVSGDITLEQVVEMYEWAGIRSMGVFPWYEDGQLVALVTGWIEWGAFGFPGEKVGFLEHFIIKPAARRKLEIMNLLPDYIAEVCRQRGVDRLVLCIHHDHPKRERLAKWATHRGYRQYGVGEFADWYTFPLKEQHDGQVLPSPEDPAGCAAPDRDR